MYMATGDRDGINTYSLGVLKSTDGGESWQRTGQLIGLVISDAIYHRF